MDRNLQDTKAIKKIPKICDKQNTVMDISSYFLIKYFKVINLLK